MSNKIYLILLGVNVLIIIVNYNLLKNPKPYLSEEVRKNLKVGEKSYLHINIVALPTISSQDLLKAKQIGKMEMLIGIGLV